jgi:hypothetical protein
MNKPIDEPAQATPPKENLSPHSTVPGPLALVAVQSDGGPAPNPTTLPGNPDGVFKGRPKRRRRANSAQRGEPPQFLLPFRKDPDAPGAAEWLAWLRRNGIPQAAASNWGELKATFLPMLNAHRPHGGPATDELGTVAFVSATQVTPPTPASGASESAPTTNALNQPAQ